MRIVAIFLSQGGLGDCGQHVVTHALASGTVKVRAIARKQGTIGRKEGKDLLTIEQLADCNLEQHVVDYSADDSASQAKLNDVLSGVDAVVACPTSRQPNMERKAEASMRNIVAAMQRCKVQRLVYLSTVGVWGRSFPWSWVGTLFDAIWLIWLREARRDFQAADTLVQQSGLDCLTVRTMGLDPRQIPRKAWKVLPASDTKGPLEINIAKADVGQFMLEQALGSDKQNGDVLIGWAVRPKPKKPFSLFIA